MKKIGEILKGGSRVPIFIGISIGVVLLLIGGFSGGGKNSDDIAIKNEKTDFTLYTEMLENKIADLCKSVQGISDAKVLLTLDRGSENVYAQNGSENISDSSYSASTDYLLITSGDCEIPLELYEITPKIRGVAVVCTGGDTATVCKTIIELLSAALGIPTNKIMVAGM